MRLWQPRERKSVLRTSLAVKLTFTVLEAILVVVFASLMDTKRNIAAAIEWSKFLILEGCPDTKVTSMLTWKSDRIHLFVLHPVFRLRLCTFVTSKYVAPQQ